MESNSANEDGRSVALKERINALKRTIRLQRSRNHRLKDLLEKLSRIKQRIHELEPGEWPKELDLKFEQCKMEMELDSEMRKFKQGQRRGYPSSGIERLPRSHGQGIRRGIFQEQFRSFHGSMVNLPKVGQSVTSCSIRSDDELIELMRTRKGKPVSSLVSEADIARFKMDLRLAIRQNAFDIMHLKQKNMGTEKNNSDMENISSIGDEYDHDHDGPSHAAEKECISETRAEITSPLTQGKLHDPHSSTISKSEAVEDLPVCPTSPRGNDIEFDISGESHVVTSTEIVEMAIAPLREDRSKKRTTTFKWLKIFRKTSDEKLKVESQDIGGRDTRSNDMLKRDSKGGNWKLKWKSPVKTIDVFHRRSISSSPQTMDTYVDDEDSFEAFFDENEIHDAEREERKEQSLLNNTDEDIQRYPTDAFSKDEIHEDRSSEPINPVEVEHSPQRAVDDESRENFVEVQLREAEEVESPDDINSQSAVVKRKKSFWGNLRSRYRSWRRQ